MVKTRYLWLTRRSNMTAATSGVYAAAYELVAGGRAWAVKESAMQLWNYQSRGRAERMWKRWYEWAIRSRLEPVQKVARMIKRHWDGVIDAVLPNVTNARSEATNAKTQWNKRLACGYRNRERFRNAIYFRLGGLDLYPDALAAHTKFGG